jgi:hypothetical protein
MNAVEIVGNLYIRNQVLEEQFNQAAQAHQQLTERLKNITSKVAAAKVATTVLKALNNDHAPDDPPNTFHIPDGFVEAIEKELNEPTLGVPTVDESIAEATVTEAAALLAKVGDPEFATKAEGA